ncbi:MAG: hypothetical protein SCALA702_12880 [Melioribacteraceae bacterium]|nr:MAG: hypothetical protein SCALA702_12880 [Melioribacteraceae bacterium]
MLLELRWFQPSASYENKSFPTFEFHIAKEIRKKYRVAEELFTSTGNIVFANHSQVRVFVQRVNKDRDENNKVTPGEINAFGLMDEIFHFIFREYELNENPGVMGRAVKNLNQEFGEEEVFKLFSEFVMLYPPLEVYKGRMSVMQYLNGFSENRSNMDITLEEMILVHFSNFNSANRRIKEFFDEDYFTNKKLYNEVIEAADEFFQEENPFGPDGQDIFQLFRTPILTNPEDLGAQLDYILNRWKLVILDKFSRRILTGKDLMREDIRFESFGNTGGGGGSAPTVVPQYKGKIEKTDSFILGKSLYNYAGESHQDYEEPEQFTPDTDWMPRVVLLAKNAYVWLDQLSKEYKREIRTLDQVPDEELDKLARWNFTGLWLIGLWERSTASKRIKHIMGNIDAAASAYSLYDYTIAHDLGGEAAYDNLNERAKKRGLRLASDMVPNHTGIYSKWVTEHPEYFVQSYSSPFPNYTFTGENLSEDPNYQIRIEDGYFRHSDAAVVFQRIDNRTGETVYMYHGNDGTNMPWNDTAQLDMLKPEVREAVIQKIFDVARRFSIIRFDAAMTLTKRHFSRLWYPQPGLGGDIPSRADYSMTREEFDSKFPVEFWREVVDRINEELPETLLLAEAFWLLEGYFVRSLGMHRVYNSAFMNMMMREENDKYRDLITNTLEFEPEILKRYVNFMSNPDEETAVKQFGSDDKYFGVLILMVTLPGLPMFAHGQIEGYTEKYGMEYKRSYYKETPHQWLIERHEREIFPLTRRRYLFSPVDDFWFFDFIDNHGEVNENVFAYTNMTGGERALIFYNNKFDSAMGRIYRSTPKLVPQPGGEKAAKTVSLAEALKISGDKDVYYIYRNHIKGKEYLLPGKEIYKNGFYLELGAFKYVVLTDFREVHDTHGDYEKLYKKIRNSGVDSIKRELDEMRLHPVHQAFENLFADKAPDVFVENYITFNPEAKRDKTNIKFVFNKYHYLLNTVKHHFSLKNDLIKSMGEFEKFSEAVRTLNEIVKQKFEPRKNIKYNNAAKSILLNEHSSYREKSVLYMWYLAVSELKFMFGEEKLNKSNYVSALLLDYPSEKILAHLGRGEYEVFLDKTLLNILLENEEKLFDLSGDAITEVEDSEKSIKEFIREHKRELIEQLLENEYVKTYIGVNYYEGVWYYSKENFEELLNWIFTLTSIKYIVLRDAEIEKQKKAKASRKSKQQLIPLQEKILKAYFVIDYLKAVSKRSGYKLEVFKEKIAESKPKVKIIPSESSVPVEREETEKKAKKKK